nr:MAG TPA_asm: hypothetical protein [Caudoviricetes sp.]
MILNRYKDYESIHKTRKEKNPFGILLPMRILILISANLLWFAPKK